jgi:hypothetical protein
MEDSRSAQNRRGRETRIAAQSNSSGLNSPDRYVLRLLPCLFAGLVGCE